MKSFFLSATPRRCASLLRSAAITVTAFAATTSGQAASLSELSSLTGRRAVVELRDGSSKRGTLYAADAAGVTVGGQSFGCEDVAQVRVNGKSNRGLWTALGAGAGLAAGLALGTRFSNEGNSQAAALTALGLAGAGGGIGFAAGGPKPHIVAVDRASCP